MYLTTRNALGSNLNCLDLTDTFVEVGVLRGDYASQVLSQWKGNKAYLIDSWSPITDQVDVTSTLADFHHTDNMMHVQDMFKYDSRVRIIKQDSHSVSKTFEDRSLQCVYLDADHSYRGVIDAVHDWWHKIAPGGMLSGHDYVNAFWGNPKDAGATWTATKLAVNHAFNRRKDASCIISSYEDGVPSWFVFKLYNIPHPSEILVLSAGTSNLKYLNETYMNHKLYCDYHGYDYKMIKDDSLFWQDSHPAWSKLKFIQEELPNYKWVMWVDADAIFVDWDQSLEKFCIPRFGHISSTWHAFNRIQLTNGVSFWQNIPWTYEFITRALSYRQEFANFGVWEEEGIRRTLDADINNYGRWLGIETTHFNSWPHFNTWNPGKDLIVHWGGTYAKKDILIKDTTSLAYGMNYAKIQQGPQYTQTSPYTDVDTDFSCNRS